MQFKVLYISILLLLKGIIFSSLCYGQAPNISYPSPQTLTIGSPVNISPSNSGGVVPPGIYGNVIRAGGQTGRKGKVDGDVNTSVFNTPLRLAVDNLGYVYVNDREGKAIRKISPDRITSTFAVTGIGPGGLPTAPDNFNNPTGIVVDAAGNVYFADSGNNIIRTITPGGTISTFAGNGQAGNQDGQGTAATFNNPTEVTIDKNNNIYVLDNGDNPPLVIRKISNTGLVSTAINQPSQFNITGGLAIDNIGNFYVAVATQNIIKKITPDGTITTFSGTGQSGADNGPANVATFKSPFAIAIDPAQNLYVLSSVDNTIRKISPGGVVSTFAGQQQAGSVDGIGTNASFSSPSGLVFDNFGNGYIADAGNSLVRKISISGYSIDKTLPTGLAFDAQTGKITGTPTALSPATDYTITAYNSYGYSTIIVRIQVIISTVLIFPSIADKTTCSTDFDPGASSPNTIIYTSSNAGVASIVNNKIHVVGVGTVSIIANDGVNTITRQFNIVAVPQATIAISSSANPSCVGNPVSFVATTTNAGTSPKFDWQINGVSTKATDITYTAQVKDGDIITCTLIPDNDCNMPLVSNSITQQVEILPTVTFPQPAIAINPGQSVNLNPVITGNVITYKWLPEAGLDDASVANPIANPAVPTVYKLLVTTQAGCTAEATISINVIAQITVNNAFSPNGDGVNDTWVIPDLAYFPGCTVKIYNRYGNLIFNATNYPKPWDGTFNGAALPSGVYYYIIDLKNKAKLVSGEVTLIR